jgi:hypothetical protein
MTVRKFSIALISISFIAFLMLAMFFGSEKNMRPNPLSARDTDGTDPSDIIKNMEGGYEMVILKVNPFGYVEIEGWESVGLLKSATLEVEWKTYSDLGAGNIYVGYSLGDDYVEIGPFNESSEAVKREIAIPVSPFTDMGNLKARFRGEDIDFGPDAIAEVRMNLRVVRYGI